MTQCVAFFGLGAMGAPMAENLLKAGCTVRTAVNRSRAAADDLAERYGLSILPSIPEAAKEADAVITILPSDAEVKSVLINDALAASLKKNAVILEMSSCTTEAVREVEDWYAPKNIFVVDAPVSGGPAGARNGTLSVFASGEKSALQTVRPLLEAMGNEIFDLGSCGTGKAFKNLNNLLTIINVAAVSEMFHAAKKQGFDMDKLFDVICAGSGVSASFKSRFKKMVNREFEGGFKLSLARKDIANAIALGQGVPMPISKLVHELLAANRACDDLDMSAMCKLFE
ncbi:MAG: NAD(P)-dependent oxidoreductase [Synergistaceae bacterium]|nr:NAD(P)-dependent oxidoreductase [Synergistaceae bacterium]